MTLGARLSWYAARMRAMSPAEMAWRARMLATSELSLRRAAAVPNEGWQQAFRRFRAADGRPVLLDVERAKRVVRVVPGDVAAVVKAADEVLDRRFGYFGAPPVAFPGPEIDWNLDPRTGHQWPLVAARTIDHRTHPGDPKWIWELNRLQHLPWLAQAWLFTADERYADAALTQLDSWIAQNPVGRGIAWRGGFEAGLRGMSVAVALQGLRTSPGLDVGRYRRAVTMLAASAALAWRERSLFSSANNHLLGEMAGVATVALLHPEIPAAQRLQTRAMSVLAREAERQFRPDGSNAEQSISYQMFAAELLAIPAALVQLRRGLPPAPIMETLRREAAYLRMLTAGGEPLPRFGDEDGGFALRLVPDPIPSLRRHLALVDAVLGDTDGDGDLAAAWLIVGAASTSGPRKPPAGDHYAPDAGLVVLRRGPLRLTMDIGPLGHLSIAAHGHADALAVTLAYEGRDVIGDPGTGSYYAEPSWRSMFRGTRVHATAAVDDADQSVPGGPFLWVRHAITTARSVDIARGVVDAEHDGYTRLPQPVVHRRWLIAPPDAGTMAVVDLFTGSGAHRFRTTWPLHPRLEAVTEGTRVQVIDAGAPILSVTTVATVTLTSWSVRGDTDSGLGWWSERFESRAPSWLVGAVTDGTAEVPVVIVTLLAAGGGEPPIGATVALVDDRIELSWWEGTVHREVSVERTRSGAVVHRVGTGG